MPILKLRECAEKLVEYYSNDLNDCFPSELLHFASYIKNRDIKSFLDMLKLKDSLRPTYPNMDISVSIFVCNFAKKRTAEKSFSALSRIKNTLRNKLTQEHTTN